MKNHIRTILCALSALTVLTFAGPAAAKDEVTQDIILEGETLEGVLGSPGGDFLRGDRITVHHSLITFRDDFIPEMVITLDDF